jgi:aromatic-L-amino-acid decarboxylase
MYDCSSCAGITHWQHPQFFAYFPSISTFESILGELYTASVSNPGFNVNNHGFLQETMELIITQWLCSPACTELEQVVLDWMAKMLGLSSTFYTSSGIGGGIIMVCVRM